MDVFWDTVYISNCSSKSGVLHITAFKYSLHTFSLMYYK